MQEPPAATWPLRRWLAEGLRAGVLLPVRLAGQQPRPWQLAALLVLLSAVELGLGRVEVQGAADFDVRGWLAPWWGTAALLLVAWWALPGAGDGVSLTGEGEAARPRGIAAWFTLWTAALLPATVVSLALGIAQAYGALPAWLTDGGWTAWAVYLLLWGWTVVVALRLARQFGAGAARLAALGAGVVAIYAVTVWQFPDRPWTAVADAEGPAPQMELTQAVFEAQQSVWRGTTEALLPQRPGVVDVYGLVFAPYADEDVFLREGTLVANVLAERFDARGRVLHLANHPDTAERLPWATPQNLRRAVEALAGRMDPAEDVLVLYLTSHGANNFQLAATHGPLTVAPVSPGDLREALDAAGIRHRVIAVSACYSGGWVGPLAGDGSLVMTAADATHTSYGCGRLSELTFFGRALWDEQLRRTHSFEQAFAAAVPVIRQREVDAGKPDGFSNPQISVGAGIRPVLQALEQRLAGQR